MLTTCETDRWKGGDEGSGELAASGSDQREPEGAARDDDASAHPERCIMPHKESAQPCAHLYLLLARDDDTYPFPEVQVLGG